MSAIIAEKSQGRRPTICHNWCFFGDWKCADRSSNQESFLKKKAQDFRSLEDVSIIADLKVLREPTLEESTSSIP
jgi:hypothetical protein